MTRALKLALVLVPVFGCSQKTILDKPAQEFDPAPVTDAAAPAAAADPLKDKQWSLGTLEAEDGITGSATLTIAILSTGVDYTHEDLVGKIHINEKEITPAGPDSPVWTNGKDDDENGLVDDIVGYDAYENDGYAFDRHGAGTALAGIIAAGQDNGVGISGLLSDCRIYPIRYIGDNGHTSVLHLTRALKAALAVKPDVILLHVGRLKLGGDFGDEDVAAVETAAVRELLDKIATQRIPVVVGAGNSDAEFGTKGLEKVLASYDNIAVVTASDQDDELAFLANYSRSEVTTTAPGTDIQTLGLGNTYRTESSTAVAAAHVAAAIGHVVTKHAVTGQRAVEALANPEASDHPRSLTRFSVGRGRLNLAKYLQLFP